MDRKTEIYERFSGKVMNYIWSKVGDKYVAEDLCSTVFVKVYEKFDTFDESKAQISTWIYTVAHNTVIDYYRTNRIMSEVPEETVAADNPELECLNNESLSELAKALEKLGERERTVVVKYYYYNESLKDIAADIGVSYSYIKILHKKALDELKSLL